jgi:hypothetical protein
MANSAPKRGIQQSVQFRSLFGDTIPFQVTIDVASNIDAAGTTEAFSVPGAALGDFVMVAHTLSAQAITITAYVSATDQVSIRYQNESGGTIDLASQTVYGVVLKKGPAFDNLA